MIENDRKKRDTAMSWCLKNNIIITAEPVDNNNVVIVINYKSKGSIIGEKFYPQKNIKSKDDRWWDEIYNLYKLYYEKHKSKP